MHTCFVFGAGSACPLRERPGAGDFVIAADAGYRACLAAGLAPDLALGDFDSLGAPPDLPNVLRLPVEKDDTDLLFALREGLRRGFRQFVIYGGTGGDRPEHTLANYQCLLFLAARGARGVLYDEGCAVTAIRSGSLTLKLRPGAGVSVFTISGEARGVTLRGLHYPLTDATLTPEFPVGVSNACEGETAEIAVRDGALLVFYEA